MALTRRFQETIGARARRDPRFREALLTEAVNAYLGGDTAEGKAILRDLVNATIGFEGLAAQIRQAEQEPAPHALFLAETPAPTTSFVSSAPCKRGPTSDCA